MRGRVLALVYARFGEGVTLSGTKTLQEGLGCISLDLVSLQMDVEEEFGLQFATGTGDRRDMDRAWDDLKSVDELVAFVEKWAKP